MTLSNPSLVLTFVGSGTIPVTTVSNAEIVRNSIQIEWQMMNDLKSTSDKAKITISKKSVAVSRIMSFDGDIKAVLKDGTTILFTGYLSNKYKWSVTEHGEQALSLTIEDNTRILETIFSDRDQLINKEFYIPARTGHPVASGLLVDICNVTGMSLDATVPEIATQIIKTIPADTECVDIMDKVCFELGYCYKFKADGKMYLWRIAKGDEPVSATIDKANLYSVSEDAVTVNKSLKQYNRAIVKYTEMNQRNNVLIYQDISGQDDTHPYCYIEVPPGTAYPSGLTIAGKTDDQLKAICDAADLAEGKTIIGIGDTITTNFSCTDASITANIQKYSATQLSVLIKNTKNVPVYILRLSASANILYEEGQTKIYAGSVSDKKYYETEMDYVHNTTSASELGNLIYQFHKHSNLAFSFYSTVKLEIGDIIKLKEDVYSGVESKLMVNARVDSTSSNVYQYAAYSFSPFNLSEETKGSSSKDAPSVVPSTKTMIQYALGDSPDEPPASGKVPKVLGSASDKVFGSDTDEMFGSSSYTESPWMPSVPYPVPSGKYVWMRTSSDTGATWAYARLTGDKGDVGETKVFALKVAYSTFRQNRRSDDAQQIPVYCEIAGYPTTAVSVITASNATVGDGYITIPLNNSFDKVIINAFLFEDDTLETTLATDEVNLTPVDETEAPMFLGCLSAVPTKTPNNEKIIDGDYWCASATFTSGTKNYEKGGCYRYSNGDWVHLTAKTGTVIELITCLRAFKQEGIDFTEISDQNAISWFSEIIADTIVVDRLKANDALFTNIAVEGNSSFHGNIYGSTINTVNGSTTSSQYKCQSAGQSGSFKWEDVATWLAYNRSLPANLTYYQAQGTVNSKTVKGIWLANNTAYYDWYDDEWIGSVDFDSKSSEIWLCAEYARVLHMKSDKAVSSSLGLKYEIGTAHYDSSSGKYVWDSTDSYGSYEYDSNGYIDTYAVIPPNKYMRTVNYSSTKFTLKGYLAMGETFGFGWNVVYSDGTTACIAGYRHTTHKTNRYFSTLTGYGNSLANLQYYAFGTWNNLIDTSSSWPSGLPKYSIFHATNAYSSYPTGNGAITSLQAASITYADGTSVYPTWATNAEWGVTYLKLTASGHSDFYIDISTEVRSYDFRFTIANGTGTAVQILSLLPMNSGCDVGTNGNRWDEGWFNTVNAGSISTSSLNLSGSLSATALYGQLGADASGYYNDAIVNNLTIKGNVSGLSFFSPKDIRPCMATLTSATSTSSTFSLNINDLEIDAFRLSSAVSKFHFTVNTSGGSGTVKYLYFETSSYASNFDQGTKTDYGSASAGTTLQFDWARSSAGALAVIFAWRTA